MTEADAPYPTTTLDAALLYAWQEWRVAPVTPGSKVPAIADWVNKASDDVDQVHAWFGVNGSHANAGVCIVTGEKSGLWVLDVDVANGKHGLQTLKDLIAANDGIGMGETLAVRTPSGGYHYYFTYPEDGDVHNSASNRLGAGLDVRGEGGQVNAPPTRRGESGYSWAAGRGPYDVEIQPAPDWLLELVKDEPRPEPVRGFAVQADGVEIPMMSAGAALRISKQAQFLDTVPTFVTDYNARTNWPELLTSAGWTPCHEANGVDYWARLGKSCREGVSASTNYASSDLLYVWSTSVEGLPSDRAYDRYGYMVHRDHGGDFDAAAASFVEKRREAAGVGEVLLPQTGWLEKSQLVIPAGPPGFVVPGQIAVAAGSVSVNGGAPVPMGATPADPEPDDGGKFEAARMRLECADFWTNDPTQKDWLIEPFLANGRAHALYASAKAGKSYVALQAIAAACVPGHASWATVPATPITVLYLDYEMTEDDLRERLSIFGYGAGDDFSKLHYVKASLLGADLDTKDGGRELLDAALAWGVQLVVVDTMSRAVSGDENDADTVRKFYQHTGRLLKAHGIAWLRIDHAGKDGDKGQRGSSAKNDDVDVVWRLERLDAGARLTRTHSRVFWIDDEILLRNVQGDGGAVTHERTHSIDAVVGLGAKVAEWVGRKIPADTTKKDLRDEYGFQFKDSDFSTLKTRVAEQLELDALAPGFGSGSRVGSQPFAPGTVEPSG